MHRTSRFSIASLALATCVLATGAQAAVVISTTPNPVVDSPGLTGFATTGADMAGMAVTVAFNNGANNTFAWTTTGPGAGGVTTALWSLTLSGDSFSSAWEFKFLNPNVALQLTHLNLSGLSGFTIFDRTEPSFGTDGSAQGLDFAFAAGSCASCNALVNYSGRTGINGAAPLGDLWQVVDVTFDAGTGPRTDFSFFQDTDNDIRVAIPEPETYALMLGGLGVMTMLARRRRPRSA